MIGRTVLYAYLFVSKELISSEAEFNYYYYFLFFTFPSYTYKILIDIHVLHCMKKFLRLQSQLNLNSGGVYDYER